MTKLQVIKDIIQEYADNPCEALSVFVVGKHTYKLTYDSCLQEVCLHDYRTWNAIEWSHRAKVHRLATAIITRRD